MAISFGVPTNPSSFFSGIVLIIFSFFGVNACTFIWKFFKLLIISEFNSKSASSTTLIVFSSVTLKPSMKFVSIFRLSSFFFILVKFPSKGKYSANNVNSYLLSKGIIVRKVDNYGLKDFLRISIGRKNELIELIKFLKIYFKKKL